MTYAAQEKPKNTMAGRNERKRDGRRISGRKTAAFIIARRKVRNRYFAVSIRQLLKRKRVFIWKRAKKAKRWQDRKYR